VEINGFESKSNVVLSCQNTNPKLFRADYIYLISYKIAKKANPMKWICLLKNDITDFSPAPELKIHSSNMQQLIKALSSKYGHKKGRAITDPTLDVTN